MAPVTQKPYNQVAAERQMIILWISDGGSCMSLQETFKRLLALFVE